MGAIPTAWTMKILESVDYSDWKHKFNCGRCDTKLEAEPSDVIVTYYPASCDPRDSYGSYYTYMLRCPVCDDLERLEEKNLPKRMIVDLKKRAK